MWGSCHPGLCRNSVGSTSRVCRLPVSPPSAGSPQVTAARDLQGCSSVALANEYNQDVNEALMGESARNLLPRADGNQEKSQRKEGMLFLELKTTQNLLLEIQTSAVPISSQPPA